MSYIENQRMLDYIKEEPKILEMMYHQRHKFIDEFVELFKNNNIKRVYLAGTGSNYHAAVAIKYIMQDLLDVEATYTYPTLFNQYEHFNINGCYKSEEILIIAPAHSGRTKGPVIAVKKAREKGIHTLCTTLLPNGRLAQNCDIVIDKSSGMEDVYAETKGHMATIYLLMMASVEASFQLNKIDEKKYNFFMKEFQQLSLTIKKSITQTMDWFHIHKDILIDARSYIFLGYGSNLSNVLEGALKFIECTGKPAIGYELEEFLHGPLQMVTENDAIFFLCDSQEEKERMKLVYKYIKKISNNNRCILIMNKSCNEDIDEDNLLLDLHECPYLYVIEYLLPLQVLTYLTTSSLGIGTINGCRYNEVGTTLETSFKD